MKLFTQQLIHIGTKNTKFAFVTCKVITIMSINNKEYLNSIQKRNGIPVYNFYLKFNFNIKMPLKECLYLYQTYIPLLEYFYF